LPTVEDGSLGELLLNCLFTAPCPPRGRLIG
jgi:hypothetical protein